ncbi:hypothetical protein IAT38_007040 [Cryptococcus sp. DSM 104549]
MAGIRPSAVAGPGPRSLLFGLRLLAASPTRPLSPSFRPFHTSLPTLDAAPSRRKPPRRSRDSPKEPSVSTHTPPPKSASTSKGKGASSPPPDPPPVSTSKSHSSSPSTSSPKSKTSPKRSPKSPSNHPPNPGPQAHSSSTSKSPPKSTKPPPKSTKSTSKPSPKPPPKSHPISPKDYENVIFLYPPPDYPIDDKVGDLLTAMEHDHLTNALAAWSSLVDLNAVSRLSGGDFECVSQYFSGILFKSRRAGPNLAKMAVNRPSDFGLLLSMAVEAAARDHGEGLYVLSLRLMEDGRPADALNAIVRSKDLTRDLRGISKEDLYSWERDKRLAARLGGKDVRSLALAQLAALTLLDRVDEHALLSMLDTQVDFLPSSRFNFTAIRRVFTAVDRSGQLYAKYRRNLERMVLAVHCHHSNALTLRIKRQSRSRIRGGLDALYERILEASAGPDAFLRPRSLDESSWMDYRSIVLPSEVWGTFIDAYSLRNDVDRIRTILERDMPARGLVLNAEFLSKAMLDMAIIAQRTRTVPKDVRSKARAYAEEYWQRLGRAGWHMEDVPFGRRLAMLSILSASEPALRQEMANLYGAAVAGHLGKIGAMTRSQFVTYFMWHYQFDEAFGVFRNLPRDASSKRHEFVESVSAIIRHLAKDRWSAKEAFSYCLKVLHLVAQSKTPLILACLGSLLSIQVNGGLPVQRTVDSILRASLHHGYTQHSMSTWTMVLHGLLGYYRGESNAFTPTRAAFEAGLFILQRATTTQLYGQKHGRELDMWLTFLLPLARSPVINLADRHDFMEAALGLFPGGRRRISPPAWLELIHVLVMRKDKTGLASGLAYWSDLVQEGENVHGWYWSQMLSLLLDAGETVSAQTVVKHAWDAHKVDLDEGFWLRAQSAGLTRALGIEAELEASQRKLVEGNKWSEPLVRPHTEHYEGGGEESENEDGEDEEGEDEVLDGLDLEYPDPVRR